MISTCMMHFNHILYMFCLSPFSYILTSCIFFWSIKQDVFCPSFPIHYFILLISKFLSHNTEAWRISAACIHDTWMWTSFIFSLYIMLFLLFGGHWDSFISWYCNFLLWFWKFLFNMIYCHFI